jgi:hypothetical protein
MHIMAHVSSTYLDECVQRVEQQIHALDVFDHLQAAHHIIRRPLACPQCLSGAVLVRHMIAVLACALVVCPCRGDVGLCGIETRDRGPEACE